MRKIIAGIALVAVLMIAMPNVAHAATMGTPEQDNPLMAIYHATEEEIDMLARLVYCEARGVDSTMEQAAVIWCALNRVDDDRWGSTIAEVVTQSGQFAYRGSVPVKDELRELAQDVTDRWTAEQRGKTDVGRVLPAAYVFFAGRSGRNWFRTDYEGNGTYWDWSLPNPYREEVG